MLGDEIEDIALEIGSHAGDEQVDGFVCEEGLRAVDRPRDKHARLGKDVKGILTQSFGIEAVGLEDHDAADGVKWSSFHVLDKDGWRARLQFVRRYFSVSGTEVMDAGDIDESMRLRLYLYPVFGITLVASRTESPNWRVEASSFASSTRILLVSP